MNVESSKGRSRLGVNCCLLLVLVLVVLLLKRIKGHVRGESIMIQGRGLGWRSSGVEISGYGAGTGCGGVEKAIQVV